MIEVTNLSKRYGSLQAVDDISFSVNEGEIVGFLGPNGAGKTSTIRILTCYHPATSGTATIGGFDVFTQSMEVRRLTGYLPEATPLYPEMRVREYLHFRGKLHGFDRSARKSAIARVTERCWLGDFVNRPIGQLSKGMKQRVGLADAMLCDPKVLVLDEPTIGLDPTQIRETRNLIKQLGEHHTILFSSHILSEVEQTCSKIILIAKGKLIAQGTPAELRARVSADSKIIAEVKGPSGEVQSAIGSIEGARDVKLDAASETKDGWNRLIITGNGQRDIREPVARLIQDKGWSLRELRREVASLED
ncbi:MAG: ATP-binding cassette domain-containing protein, partial [Planctomycetes bacterium]|nr:ATP-binding cassette domain-containing protein [Planctomycetota bacterium]